jgi:hypothetical protein
VEESAAIIGLALGSVKEKTVNSTLETACLPQALAWGWPGYRSGD